MKKTYCDNCKKEVRMVYPLSEMLAVKGHYASCRFDGDYCEDCETTLSLKLRKPLIEVLKVVLGEDNADVKCLDMKLKAKLKGKGE